jgi:hypothetical protein
LNRKKEASMYGKPIGTTAHGVIENAFATLNTLSPRRSLRTASDFRLAEKRTRSRPFGELATVKAP